MLRCRDAAPSLYRESSVRRISVHAVRLPCRRMILLWRTLYRGPNLQRFKRACCTSSNAVSKVFNDAQIPRQFEGKALSSQLMRTYHCSLTYNSKALNYKPICLCPYNLKSLPFPKTGQKHGKCARFTLRICSRVMTLYASSTVG